MKASAELSHTYRHYAVNVDGCEETLFARAVKWMDGTFDVEIEPNDANVRDSLSSAQIKAAKEAVLEAWRAEQ